MDTFEVESSTASDSTGVDHEMPVADQSAAQNDGAEDDITPFTIWVGGIPERCSSQPDHRVPTRGTPALKHEFSKFGEVVSMSVRRKEGDLKNWALITFVDSSSVAAALKGDVTVLGDDGMPVLLITRGVTPGDLASADAGAVAGKQEKLLKRYRTLSKDSSTSSPAVDSTGKQSATENVFEKEDKFELEINEVVAGSAPPPMRPLRRLMLKESDGIGKMYVYAMNDDQVLSGISFGIWGVDSRFRQACFVCIHSKIAETFVLISIVVQTGLLITSIPGD
jgi:hypothetical protein